MDEWESKDGDVFDIKKWKLNVQEATKEPNLTECFPCEHSERNTDKPLGQSAPYTQKNISV